MKTHSTVAIDSAGRLVIPKAIRERLRLRAGTRVRLAVEDGRLTLQAEPDGGDALARRDGILVLAGELEGAPPNLEEIREERVARVSGPRR